jgi:hypothetical protein
MTNTEASISLLLHEMAHAWLELCCETSCWYCRWTKARWDQEIGIKGHGTVWPEIAAELQSRGSQLLSLELDLYRQESKWWEKVARKRAVSGADQGRLRNRFFSSRPF